MGDTGQQQDAATEGWSSLMRILGYVPGLAWFVANPPPLLPAHTLVTGGLSLVLAFAGFEGMARGRRGRRMVLLPLAGFVLAAIYGVLLGYTSLPLPPDFPDEGYRLQVGFSTLGWSLTPRGLKTLTLPHDEADMEFVAQACSEYGPSRRAEKCWKPWSVLLAGGLLILLFMASVCVWSYGWGTFVAASRKPAP